jgi:hypothetical protein
MGTMTDAGELPAEHAALLEEARPGIEKLVARMTSRADVVFLVTEIDSALGRTIIGLGVPRHPNRKTVVMPLTREDALRAAGPLMSGSLSEKLEAHEGPAVLVMANGSGRLVGLTAVTPR